MFQACALISSATMDLGQVKVKDDEQNVGGCVQDACGLDRCVKKDQRHGVCIAAILSDNEEEHIEEAGQYYQQVDADIDYIQGVYQGQCCHLQLN